MDAGRFPVVVFLFFLALFILSLVLLSWLLRPFFSILVLAFVVTGMFMPLFSRLKKRMKPKLASALVCVIIFLVLFVPIVVLVGMLSSEAYGLFVQGRDAAWDEQVRELLSQSLVLDKATQFFGRYGVSLTLQDLNQALASAGKAVGKFLFDQTSAVATNILAFIFNFFFMLLVIYFFFLDGPGFMDFITDLSPLPQEQDDKIINKFQEMSASILLVNGLGGLIQGLVGGLVFAFFGISKSVLWGVIMGILAFLPIVGVGVVFIPASVLFALKGNMGTGIALFVIFLLLSGGVEYFLKPKLVGNRVRMHPLLVFLAIVGGLKLFGILGVIYGPLVVTLFLTLTEIYRGSYQAFVDPEKPGGKEPREPP